MTTRKDILLCLGLEGDDGLLGIAMWHPAGKGTFVWPENQILGTLAAYIRQNASERGGKRSISRSLEWPWGLFAPTAGPACEVRARPR